MTKPVFRVPDKIIPKPSEISLGASFIILFNKPIAKALVRLRGCAGWSVLLMIRDPDDSISSVSLEQADYNLDLRQYLGQPYPR